jgi:hypothetical protein
MHEVLTEMQYLDEGETSSFTRCARQTLANWRHLKKGPPYVKAGGKVLYRFSDLKEWMESHLIHPEEQR